MQNVAKSEVLSKIEQNAFDTVVNTSVVNEKRRKLA
jgi:hypothetical protein